MGYLFLLLTVVSETVAVVFMKLSDGFQNKLHAGIAAAAYIVSFVFLTLSLKHLHAGIANAIWAGASTVLVAILGIFIFKEQPNTLQWICLFLIVAGIVGLSVTKTA